MSRIVRFHAFGAPDVLKLEERDPPEPGRGEVRIAVRAIGLNWADALWRQNMYVEDAALPSGIGQEVARRVEAVGADVEAFAVGDDVVSLPGTHQGRYPGYGDHALMPATHLMRRPGRLGPEQAAAVPIAYLTGYFALFEIAKLSAGQTVLVTGASSSTGCAAIQMARSVGATVVATTRGAAKKALLLETGAHEVVVTDAEDVAERVKGATGGRSVDLVYNGVGGAQFGRLFEVVGHRGWYILYGLSGGFELTFPAIWPFKNSWRFHAYKVTEFTGSGSMGLPRNAAAVERAVSFVTAGIERGDFKPRIDRTFPLDDVVEAHRHLERGGHVGKIVLTVP